MIYETGQGNRFYAGTKLPSGRKSESPQPVTKCFGTPRKGLSPLCQQGARKCETPQGSGGSFNFLLSKATARRAASWMRPEPLEPVKLSPALAIRGLMSRNTPRKNGMLAGSPTKVLKELAGGDEPTQTNLIGIIERIMANRLDSFRAKFNFSVSTSGSSHQPAGLVLPPLADHTNQMQSFARVIPLSNRAKEGRRATGPLGTGLHTGRPSLAQSNGRNQQEAVVKPRTKPRVGKAIPASLLRKLLGQNGREQQENESSTFLNGNLNGWEPDDRPNILDDISFTGHE